MLTLKENPTLKDYQEYVRSLEVERGFQDEGVLQKCLLMSEELGELYEVVTDSENPIHNDRNSLNSLIGEELADIVIVMCTITNRLNIDLEEELKSKGVHVKSTTLPVLQQYIKKSERGGSFDQEDFFRCCLILGRQIGRMDKAIRKQTKATRVDHNSNFVSIGEASTKVIQSLCQIANYCDIDLEQSFRLKESLNKKRTWV